jgi:hypothetical protein
VVRHHRVVVRPRHFSTDALRGRTLLQRLDAKSTYSSQGPTCARVPRAADVVAAEYQHAPAALVYRRTRGGSQVVDLFVCGIGRPVRSTTLPAP